MHSVYILCYDMVSLLILLLRHVPRSVILSRDVYFLSNFVCSLAMTRVQYYTVTRIDLTRVLLYSPTRVAAIIRPKTSAQRQAYLA